jgi:hypothetical protein
MRILMISTVREFFRQRAGMFFVVLGILFGFLSSREHYSFALFFLTDAYGMYYLFAVWLVYSVLCTQFVIKLWSLPAYQFIYNTRLWAWPKRFGRYFLMAIGLLQPLVYYGVYVISIARQDQLLHRIWPIFLFYVILSLAVVFAAEWRVRHPHVYHVQGKRSVKWPFRRPVSWTYWSFEWLIREKGVTFLVCKIGAMGVVLGTLLYYGTDKFDLRMPAIGMSLGYLLNVGLSYELYKWESEIWLWNRTLPITIFRRFLRMISVHAMLIFPETLIAIKQNTLNIFEIIQLYGLGLSTLVLFHVYLYKKDGLLEDTMQPVLFGFIILTFAVLYKIPVPILTAAILTFSFYRFPSWYRGSAM